MKHLKNWFRHKKIGLLTLLFLLTFLLAPEALASTVNPVTEGFGAILALIMKVLLLFSLWAVDIAGPLMGTEHITGPVPLLVLQPLWVFVRNICNILLVGVFLFIIVTNLFTFGQGNWSVKNKLGPFILALVLINFSLLGMKLAVDAVQVATYSVLTLPHYSVGEPMTYKKLLNSSCHDQPDFADSQSCKNRAKSFKEEFNKNLCSSEANYLCIDESNIADRLVEPERMIFLAFAIYLTNLEMLASVPEKINSIFELADNLLFGSIMAIAYALVLGATVFALLARMVVLWLGIVASPFLVMAFALGLEGNVRQFLDTIVAHLLIPLKVALAFAISFIMIANVMPYDPGDSFIKLGTTLQSWGNNSYALLWKIATVFIFWQAAKWALKDNVAAFITEGIMKSGETVGQAAVGFAANAPILPVGKDAEGNARKIGAGTIASLPNMLLGDAKRRGQQSYGNLQEALNLGGSSADQGEREAERILSNRQNNQAFRYDEKTNRELVSLLRQIRDGDNAFEKAETYLQVIDGNFKTELAGLIGANAQSMTRVNLVNAIQGNRGTEILRSLAPNLQENNNTNNNQESTNNTTNINLNGFTQGQDLEQIKQELRNLSSEDLQVIDISSIQNRVNGEGADPLATGNVDSSSVLGAINELLTDRGQQSRN